MELRLERFPLLARDACLFEDALEQAQANVSLVGIGNTHIHIAA